VRPPVALRRLPPPTRESALIGALVAVGTLVTVAAALKLGIGALALPIGVIAAVVLLRFPGPMLVLAVAAVILCENGDFGLFPQTAKLYSELFKGFMPIDAILAISLLGTIAQLIQDRRSVRLPPAPLAFPLALLGLALVSGIVVGREAGTGVSDSLLKVHTFVYLALVPLIAVNLRVSERDLRRVLAGGAALALVKALLGLLVVATGKGLAIDSSVLTYYEPAANWLMTVALLSILAAVLARTPLPLWVKGSAPLLLLALVLSYRRSFWIADLLGIALVFLLGLSAGGRKVLLPGVVLVGVAIWALGGVAVQSDTPLGQRVQSLSSSNIQAKPDDRYRLDERANVVAAIKDHPIAGLGIGVPWEASARPLPVEVNPDHQYVHFAVLYWWLKLGLLGMLAYVAMLASALVMSLRVWQRSREPIVRAFGLGSLCSVIGLAVIETTATFSGTDARFTLVFAGQLALLAVLWRRAAVNRPAAP
jgi:O-Antigen ligase